jgi:hypothetical protein
LSHPVDVAGEVPGHEELLGARAERIGPWPPLDTERLRQLGRDRLGEQPRGFRRVVAHQLVAAGLVLDLDHNHRVLRVSLAQMRHQPRERARVRRQRFLAVRAQRVMRAAVGMAHAREAAAVGLDPERRVACPGVLPGREPQQHQPLVVRSGLLEQRVDEGEIEPTLDRLDLLPRDRHQQRVGADPFDRRPHLLEHARIVRRVVRLRAEDQERLAIDDQGRANVTGGEVRRLGPGRDRSQRQQGTSQRGESDPLPHASSPVFALP